MPFLLAEILNFQGSTHRIGVGSFSQLNFKCNRFDETLVRAVRETNRTIWSDCIIRRRFNENNHQNKQKGIDIYGLS